MTARGGRWQRSADLAALTFRIQTHWPDMLRIAGSLHTGSHTEEPVPSIAIPV